MRRAALALLLAVASVGATAQPAARRAQQHPPPAAAPAGCSDAQYRVFDFWGGSWMAISADGSRVLGHSAVLPVLGGCALEQRWTGGTGFHAQSFAAYDREQGLWRLMSADQGGNTLLLQGGWTGTEMSFSGEHTRDGMHYRDRMVFTPLASGHVRQTWESMPDGGNWNSQFEAELQHTRN
ncbi:MAG TPA: hypothetical protein VHE37_13645 [Nevskiaceae bacterium]|nr:hypothetical protein [Nevskiaceae bacterium]